MENRFASRSIAHMYGNLYYVSHQDPNTNLHVFEVEILDQEIENQCLQNAWSTLCVMTQEETLDHLLFVRLYQ
jgi:hypothetical protein